MESTFNRITGHYTNCNCNMATYESSMPCAHDLIKKKKCGALICKISTVILRDGIAYGMCFKRWTAYCYKKKWDNQLSPCANRRCDELKLKSKIRKQINAHNIREFLSIPSDTKFKHITGGRIKQTNLNDVTPNDSKIVNLHKKAPSSNGARVTRASHHIKTKNSKEHVIHLDETESDFSDEINSDDFVIGNDEIEFESNDSGNEEEESGNSDESKSNDSGNEEEESGNSEIQDYEIESESNGTESESSNSLFENESENEPENGLESGEPLFVNKPNKKILFTFSDDESDNSLSENGLESDDSLFGNGLESDDSLSENGLESDDSLFGNESESEDSDNSVFRDESESEESDAKPLKRKREESTLPSKKLKPSEYHKRHEENIEAMSKAFEKENVHTECAIQ